MLVVPRATAYLILLLLRCRPKAQAIRTCLTPKNLNPTIQSASRHMTVWRSRLRNRAKRRKSLKSISKIALESGRNSLRLLALTPRPQKRKKRNVTSVRSHVLTIIKKATMPATVPSNKTSVDLDNFCISD